MIDIRNYPGVLDRLNYILNGGEEAELKVEDDNTVRVARHTRVYMGRFDAESDEPVKSRMPARQG